MYMIKSKKSLIACTIILNIMISDTSFANMKLLYDGKEHNYTSKDIILTVNEKTIKTDVPPVIIDGKTLVPARAVFEELGSEVLWIKETQETFVTLDNNVILLKVNDNIANINGVSKPMEIGAKIINNSVMIPLRFVAEALNFSVNWDSQNRIVSINSVSTPIDNVTIDSVIEKTDINTIPEIPNNNTTIDNGLTYETSNTNNDILNQPIIGNIQGQNGQIVKFKNNSNYPSYDNTQNSILKPEKYDVVDIISIDTPKAGDESFKINATGKISSVTYGVLENPSRLYIDIENSVQDMDSIISNTQSDIVSYISVSEKAKTSNTVRIVFDIERKQNYDIYFSEDRTSLNIKFKPITIGEITFQNLNEQDIINIYANSAFTPIITYSNNPNAVIIDIPNSISNMGNMASNISGKFISAISINQFDSNTVRMILNKTGLVDYDISSNGSNVTIKIITPTYKNLTYENDNIPRIVLNKNNNTNINSIIHDDKYLESYYKITLPEDYLNTYGYGTYKVNDTYLNSIKVQNNNGNTELILNQKNVYAYTITEDEKNIYINILNPKQVYKNIVLLDPGHGGSVPGTVQNGIKEKDINLDVSNRLYKLLDDDPNIKVYATRITDVYPDFPERTDLANHVADIFVSMHCNSGNKKISGIQMFYPNPIDNRGNTSKQLADIIGVSAASYSGISKMGADQTIGYELWVLRKTTIPACLIEMGFLTNASDMSKLSDANNRQLMAQGIYEGIKKAFSETIPER